MRDNFDQQPDTGHLHHLTVLAFHFVDAALCPVEEFFDFEEGVLQLLDDLRGFRRHAPDFAQGGFRSLFEMRYVGLGLFHIQRLILVTTIDFPHKVAKLRLDGELQ